MPILDCTQSMANFEKSPINVECLYDSILHWLPTVFSPIIPLVLFKKIYCGVGIIEGKGLFKGDIISKIFLTEQIPRQIWGIFRHTCI